MLWRPPSLSRPERFVLSSARSAAGCQPSLEIVLCWRQPLCARLHPPLEGSLHPRLDSDRVQPFCPQIRTAPEASVGSAQAFVQTPRQPSSCHLPLPSGASSPPRGCRAHPNNLLHARACTPGWSAANTTTAGQLQQTTYLGLLKTLRKKDFYKINNFKMLQAFKQRMNITSVS